MDTQTTEVTIVGANCPFCFNATIDVLRREPGVIAVDASIGECLRIQHRDVTVDHLVDVVRGHLHADDRSSAEHVMVAVEPTVAALHCTHNRPSDGRPDA